MPVGIPLASARATSSTLAARIVSKSDSRRPAAARRPASLAAVVAKASDGAAARARWARSGMVDLEAFGVLLTRYRLPMALRPAPEDAPVAGTPGATLA